MSYLDLLRVVRNNGEGHADRTGVGTTSYFGHQLRHPMARGFPLLTTKFVPFRWVAEELFWFLSGSTHEGTLRAKGVDIWKEWATAEQCAKFGRGEGDLGPVYGKLWRDFNGNFMEVGNDQISTLLRDLEANPQSRRLIVTGWHPVLQRKVALPPCHTLWQIKAHEDDSLSLSLYARSIDAFLGLPFNIASYGLLLELLAHATNRTARDLIISFVDLHSYNNHRDQVKEQLSRSPYALPRLRISERLRGQGLIGLLQARWSDLDLTDYTHHPKIKAEVAV